MTLSPPLFRNYLLKSGSVKPDFVETKLQELKGKHDDLAVPLAATFARFETLVDLAEATNIPYTLAQHLAIAISIIEKTGKFGSALKDRYALAPVDQTWPRFKSHFKDARNMLKKTGQLDSVANNQFQANALPQIVFDDIRDAINTPDQQYCGFTQEGHPSSYELPPTQLEAPPKSIETPPSADSTDVDDASSIQLLSMNQHATGYQMVTPRETERKDFLPNSASLTLL